MLSAKGTIQFKTSCFTGELMKTQGRKTEIVQLEDDGEAGLRVGRDLFSSRKLAVFGGPCVSSLTPLGTGEV